MDSTLKKCIIRNVDDLFCICEARPFINKECVILKQTKAGLFQVQLVEDPKQIYSFAKRYIEIIENATNN